MAGGASVVVRPLAVVGEVEALALLVLVDAQADEDVDDKEKALLDKLAASFKLSAERKDQLVKIAQDLESLRKDGAPWSEQVVALFKSIPPNLEEQPGDYEVVFG